MNNENYINLVKGNTCFKSQGSCIDPIITNRRYSFKHTSSTETGPSEHHHLISSNIVPVHKKKDLTDESNYRPVSILPLLSKVFEKMIFDQLYIHMNNFLNEQHYGLRKVHSTQHVLFKLLQA